MSVFVGVGVSICVCVGVLAGVRVAAGVGVGAAKRGVEQPARYKMEIIMNENLMTLFKTPPFNLFSRIFPQKVLHHDSKQIADNSLGAYEQAWTVPGSPVFHRS